MIAFISENKLTIVLLLLLGAALGTQLSHVKHPAANQAATSYEAYAETIVETCADEAYRPACYDIEIPKVMDEGLSMEDAFEVTRVVQRLDDKYQYCHVLGHYLSAKETAKDPSRWKEVVTRAPSGICSNGAIHGAFQERFRAESLPNSNVEELKEELVGICDPREDWEATGLERATCIHALGHLTMYITDADIRKSVALCDEIAVSEDGFSAVPLCYDGAFMQIYQPLDPDDFALIAGKEIETKAEAMEFCAQFDGEVHFSCVSESWPLYYNEIKEPRGVDTFCSQFSDDRYAEESCYRDIFYVLTALSNLDLAWVESFCPNVNEIYRGQCFANAASRIIEIDWGNTGKAVAACEIAARYDEEEICFKELLFYATYNFVPDSPELHTLCSRMPEPWGMMCRNQQQ